MFKKLSAAMADEKKRKKLLTASLLMLLVPEVLFSNIIGFATMFINDSNDFYSLIKIRNVYFAMLIVCIQFLGIIGLIISTIFYKKQEKNNFKKNALYLLILFLALLSCFIGFIFFLLFTFRNLSIGL